MSPDPFFDRPDESEFAPFYAGYIAKVPAGNVLDLLDRESRATRELLGRIGEERAEFRYAPGKWSIKEVVGHLCDAERIFAYRALRIGRGDSTALPGFDENLYVPNGHFERRTLSDLIDELGLLRQATVALFRHFDGDALARRGTANGNPISVRALGIILVGHELHHRGILVERYGAK
jgi:uncharacterized damage-inducible protein DinB